MQDSLDSMGSSVAEAGKEVGGCECRGVGAVGLLSEERCDFCVALLSLFELSSTSSTGR